MHCHLSPQTDKHVVLVMEYASRGDLYGIQRATAEHPFGRRQDEGRVVSVVLRPLLAALAFLHSRGICHRGEARGGAGRRRARKSLHVCCIGGSRLRHYRCRHERAVLVTRVRTS
jgi:hypothetical protein